eukprot:2070955-Heterocapsa_arctica.AAC.1
MGDRRLGQARGYTVAATSRGQKLKRKDTTLSASELFASTPPLEMLKLMLSFAMTLKKSKRGLPLKLSVVDICRAHFHARAKRRVFVTLPDERYEE